MFDFISGSLDTLKISSNLSIVSYISVFTILEMKSELKYLPNSSFKNSKPPKKNSKPILGLDKCHFMKKNNIFLKTKQ